MSAKKKTDAEETTASGRADSEAAGRPTAPPPAVDAGLEDQTVAVRGLPLLYAVAIQGLIIVSLLLFHVTRVRPADAFVVLADIEIPEEREFIDVLKDLSEEITFDESVAFQSPMVGSVAESSSQASTNLTQARAESAAVGRIQDNAMLRPIASLSGDVSVGGELEGLVGESLDLGGDAGSVDRIVLEIKRNLERGKVLVAWVMDASGSLAQRREQIIERFDRIYEELEILGLDRNKALLTGVVAFGARTQFVTAKPTDDREAIREAVRKIPPDKSGEENVFAAITKTCEQWRGFSTAGRRKLMVIAVTDERGDDPARIEDTIEVADRCRASVYCLGPVAPFGRTKLPMTVVEPESQMQFTLQVSRGPETLRPERLKLPYWGQGPQFDLVPSGFGPYGLTRLCRDTGGIYFLYDDGRIPSANFNIYDMADYAPDYDAFRDYDALLASRPVRRAVVEAALESQGALEEPPLRFDADDLNRRLTQAQKVASTTLLFVERALEALEAIEEEARKEPAPRWRANFQLMMGRLLSARVRCNEYNWALAQLKTGALKPEGRNNQWFLVPSEDLLYGFPLARRAQLETKSDGEDAKKKKKKATKLPAETVQARKEAEKAKEYLRRLTEEHPATPWSLLAQRELDAPLGFEWRQTYVPDVEETRSDSDRQMEMEMRKRREDARKRLGGL